MNPAFIYFNEIILKDDNKFTPDFSDKEFFHEVNFVNNLDYYITSLNCKLKVKNYLQKVDFYLKKVQHTKMILII